MIPEMRSYILSFVLVFLLYEISFEASFFKLSVTQTLLLCYYCQHRDCDSGSQFLRHDQRSFILLLLVKQCQSSLPSSMVLAEPQLVIFQTCCHIY